MELRVMSGARCKVAMRRCHESTDGSQGRGVFGRSLARESSCRFVGRRENVKKVRAKQLLRRMRSSSIDDESCLRGNFEHVAHSRKLFEKFLVLMLLCNTPAVCFVHDFPSRSMHITFGGGVSENCVFVKGGCCVRRFCFRVVGR